MGSQSFNDAAWGWGAIQVGVSPRSDRPLPVSCVRMQHKAEPLSNAQGGSPAILQNTQVMLTYQLPVSPTTSGWKAWHVDTFCDALPGCSVWYCLECTLINTRSQPCNSKPIHSRVDILMHCTAGPACVLLYTCRQMQMTPRCCWPLQLPWSTPRAPARPRTLPPSSPKHTTHGVDMAAAQGRYVRKTCRIPFPCVLVDCTASMWHLQCVACHPTRLC